MHPSAFLKEHLNPIKFPQKLIAESFVVSLTAGIVAVEVVVPSAWWKMNP
jgi:hypothetical protein